MKKKFLLFALLCCSMVNSYAANLVEVYLEALKCDTIFQQAIDQRLATKEGLPISISALLPNIVFTAYPSLTRSAFSGSSFSIDPTTGIPLSPRNNTARAYAMKLVATQTIFDFSKFAQVAGQIYISHGADATLNAALQDLMTRTASAYFAVLNDEDNLSYTEATRLAFKEQLDQVQQQYEVGLKTITDVYTAKASFETADANNIAAKNALLNDREKLRVITGRYYTHLSSLSEDFPLIVPIPADIDAWTHVAEQQNWSIKSSQYDVNAKRQAVKQQFAGHLPTVNAQGTLDRFYVENINGYQSLTSRNGPGTQTDRILALNISVPIFSGGAVVAQTNQASYNFRLSQQKLEQTIRQTISTTRQNYLNIISGVSQIKADRQAIISNKSSVAGMEASYKVGTETLVNVLNQRTKLFQAQTTYAADRYAFVNSILALKQAAGTLSFEDIREINTWLIDKPRSESVQAEKEYYNAKAKHLHKHKQECHS